MQGADLSDVVLGRNEDGPDSAFFEILVTYGGDGTPYSWRGVRTGRYMYARTETRPWVLYDLKDDPSELKDLADDPAHAGLREQMESKPGAWMRKSGDSWALNSNEPVEDQGRLDRFQAFYTIQEYLDWAAKHPDLAPKD